MIKTTTLFLLSALLAPIPTLGAQVRTPELAGRWRYNEARSDRLQDKLPPDPYYGSMPQGMPTRPPGGSGDSARGSQGRQQPRRRPTGPGVVGETGLIQAIRQPPAILRITLDDTTVTFSDELDQTRTRRTDGKKETEDIGGIRMERKVFWEKGDLVMEDKVKDGGLLRTTFRYDRVLKRMTVLARYSGPRYTTVVEIRRVYDRILEEGPAPPG
jgi:hypothetical protein